MHAQNSLYSPPPEGCVSYAFSAAYSEESSGVGGGLRGAGMIENTRVLYYGRRSGGVRTPVQVKTLYVWWPVHVCVHA